MPDYVIKEVEQDEQTDETQQENGSKKQDGKKPEEKTGKQSRQERKAELERELNDLEEELKSEANEAAEGIIEDEPAKSDVNKEAKDEAAAIAAGHGLTQAEENRLAEAISAKVMENLKNMPTESRKQTRIPDKRPKPTHFSERTILGRRKE